jgi:hypothetical protein
MLLSSSALAADLGVTYLLRGFESLWDASSADDALVTPLLSASVVFPLLPCELEELAVNLGDSDTLLAEFCRAALVVKFGD